MKQYWQNLQPRDQRILLIGAVIVVPLLLYSLIIEPFQQSMTRLEEGVKKNTELLAWMEQAAAQVKTLRGSGTSTSNSGASLLSVVDASAKQNGLGSALKQVKPDGNGVRLRFEQAGFDDMVRWLGRLGSEQGVGVTSLTLERLSVTGQVNATVVLERGV